MNDEEITLTSELIYKARLAEEYLDIAEVLIMALDDKYNVTMINQKGASILGYTKDEIIGKNFMENFLPPRIKEEICKVGNDIIHKEKDFQRYYENPILTKNGEERLIAWKNTQLKDKNANSIGVLTSGEDITEVRVQQQRILQKNRLEQMGEMMSMIAHQWRQPLTVISTIAATLQIKLQMNGGNNLCSNELENINTQVHHLSTIIDDFKNFYKSDKSMKTVKLEGIVESALNIISAALHNKNIKFEKKYESEVKVEVMYSEMTQVVLNILQNAKDNFEEKQIENPEIKIVTRDGVISISDNGGGIPADIIDSIFDPYFSTKDDKNGTGLGLYMSRMIIEEHHKGKLIVENIEDGVCFHIDLNK